MRNKKTLIAHCKKYYNKKLRDLKTAAWRFDARGQRVPMTDAGRRAEARQIQRDLAATLARIDRAEATGGIRSLKIRIDWHKSSPWGWNPTAEAWIGTAAGEGTYTTGRASGCGYDKESAAAAEAISGAAFDFLIFDNMRLLKKKGVYPYDPGDRWCLPLFHFSGCGMECLRQLAEATGYEWHEMHGKTFDGYEMQKKKGGRKCK